MDVLDPLDLPALGGGAAHALLERHADAGRAALEGAKHEFAPDIAVEADPVDVWKRLEDEGRGIGHVCNRVRLSRDQALKSARQVAVHGRLVGACDLEI